MSPRMRGGAVAVLLRCFHFQEKRRSAFFFRFSNRLQHQFLVGVGKRTFRWPIMPIFAVNTNVAKSDVPLALLSEATEELAKAMGKPAQVGLDLF